MTQEKQVADGADVVGPATPDQATPGLLARRLEELFRTVHPAGRGPYTYREVAQRINDHAGRQIISANYLMYLRTGQRVHPAYDKLAAIAAFFGVDPDYFSQPDTHLDPRRAEALAALHHDDVRRVARHAAGLSADTLTAILAIIDHARLIERLPPVDDTAPQPADPTRPAQAPGNTRPARQDRSASATSSPHERRQG